MSRLPFGKARKRQNEWTKNWKSFSPSFFICSRTLRHKVQRLHQKRERVRKCVWVSERERAPPVAAVAAHGPLLIVVKKKKKKKVFKKKNSHTRLRTLSGRRRIFPPSNKWLLLLSVVDEHTRSRTEKKRRENFFNSKFSKIYFRTLISIIISEEGPRININILKTKIWRMTKKNSGNFWLSMKMWKKIFFFFQLSQLKHCGSVASASPDSRACQDLTSRRQGKGHKEENVKKSSGKKEEKLLNEK